MTLLELATGTSGAPSPVVSSSAAEVAVITTAAAPSVAVELPPVETDPEVAAVIEGTPRRPAEGHVAAPAGRSRAVLRTILGLVAIAILAWIGGHPRSQEFERRMGISQVITAGFPFVILGWFASLPVVGILTDGVLAELSPLLRLGLGWAGFVVGSRFDARRFSGLPRGTARLVVLATTIPFVLVLATTGLLLFVVGGFGPETLRDPVFVRDAIILGTAGAMTAATAASFGGGETGTMFRVIRLEELAGIAGLAIVAAYFRPQGAGVTWQLPGTAWLFLTIGLGVTLGAVAWGVLHRAHTDAEFVLLTIGVVAFAAGAAGYLHLSSVAVAFVAGVVVANLPADWTPRLVKTLDRLERPVYLISLVVIGAVWNPTDPRGWLLVPLFAGARLAGKRLAMTLASESFDLEGGRPIASRADLERLVWAPIGPLAIVIVVNAQLLYPGGSISLVVAAVIGGAIVTELFVQLLGRRETGA